MSGAVSSQALLQITQWLSPNFPVGGFAFSHGLEYLIADGAVQDACGFKAWLQDTLECGAGWSDAVLLSQVLQTTANQRDLNDLATALAPSRERLEETARQGAAFVRATNALCAEQLPDLALPIAVGVRASRLRLAPETVIALYLQSFAGTLTAVATRAIPLGQSEAQSVLADVMPLIGELSDRAASATLENLGSAVLGGDLASICHETQDVRLFQS